MFGACMLMSVSIAAAASAEGGKMPAFGYSSSGSCIASPPGFEGSEFQRICTMLVVLISPQP
jgi:hypothetical protein